MLFCVKIMYLKDSNVHTSNNRSFNLINSCKNKEHIDRVFYYFRVTELTFLLHANAVTTVELESYCVQTHHPLVTIEKRSYFGSP